MRVHAWMLAVVGLLAGYGLVLADDAKDDAVKKEREKLAGKWQVVSLEVDGMKTPEDMLAQASVTIDAKGKITVTVDGNVIIEATTKIDPSKKPKTVDITYTLGDLKGQTALGIYALDGDTYRYCRAAPDKDRPTEFSAKQGSGNTMAVYKRSK